MDRYSFIAHGSRPDWQASSSIQETQNLAVACTLFLLVAATSRIAAGEPPSPPAPGRPSGQTYHVAWLPKAKLVLDGRPDEPEWKRASEEKHFVYPWKKGPAPATRFRALCDGTNLWFTFRVRDSDIVVLDKLRDEEDEVFEDRVEIYLGRDEAMKDYFCFEIDSRGRIFDYRGSFWRHLDTKWTFAGLEAAASKTSDGYEVEGRLPLKSLNPLGFPPIKPGSKILCGLYRAEFSHDRTGRVVDQKETLHNLGRKVEGPPPIEEWISWVDPKRVEPDFHIPATFGWLELNTPE